MDNLPENVSIDWSLIKRYICHSYVDEIGECNCSAPYAYDHVVAAEKRYKQLQTDVKAQAEKIQQLQKEKTRLYDRDWLREQELGVKIEQLQTELVDAHKENKFLEHKNCVYRNLKARYCEGCIAVESCDKFHPRKSMQLRAENEVLAEDLARMAENYQAHAKINEQLQTELVDAHKEYQDIAAKLNEVLEGNE